MRRALEPSAATDDATRQRILAKLDQPPPKGYARWNGTLLAEALGMFPSIKSGGCCAVSIFTCSGAAVGASVPTPQFAAKAADIVGLYLHPPDNAVVLAVDEKPHIQGWSGHRVI